MTPLEILVTILAVLTLVKFLVFLANPKSLTKMTEGLFKNAAVPMILYVVIAVIVGYFIFSVMNIVQVFAAMTFGVMLVGLALASYPKASVTLMKSMMKDRGKMWFCWLIWIVLSVWALYAIFA